MDGVIYALIAFSTMLVLIAVRMPIGLAMLTTGALGYTYLTSASTLFYHIKANIYPQFSNYTLSVIPLFILMGALAERSGDARLIFEVAEKRLGHVRGGLPMAVILACTAFGSICGSSVATTATFGRAALPEMMRAGCEAGFATATIAIGGTLGILIPPSVILIIYAIIAEQNIAKLFQAALIPGLLATLFYCATIAIMVRWKPDCVPPPKLNTSSFDVANFSLSRKQRWLGTALAFGSVAIWFTGNIGIGLLAFLGVLAAVIAFIPPAVIPVLGIAVIVIGGIYSGFFTPTEGAAIGAVIMGVLGLAQRKLGRKDISIALLQTGQTTGMIFLILLGADLFSSFLALTRTPILVAQMISDAGLPPMLILMGTMATYLVLGAVMDELAMLFLTLPLFAPIIFSLDFGMPADDVGIWFGILVLVVVGVGLTAPPIGMNIFVINKIADGVPISKSYYGILPFIFADMLRLSILISFPALSLWLVHFFN
ncbi:MAG: TRAP transporter large permease [Nitrospiraceae bacterium]